MMRPTLVPTLALVLALPVFAGERTKVDEKSVYTLYQGIPSLDGGPTRLHVATFDAAAGADWNRNNCETVARLYKPEAGARVSHWCEPGWFKRK
jgi:hypothetical protein